MTNPIARFRNKVIETKSDLESDFAALSKRGIKAEDEMKEVTSRDKLKWGAIGGIGTLAASIGVPLLVARIRRKPVRFSIPDLMVNTAIGSSVGYFSPEIRNKMIQEARGEITPEELKRSLREYGRRETKVEQKFQGFADTMEMDKQAGLPSFAFRVLGKGIKHGVPATGHLLWQGLRTGKNRPIGTRIWSAAFKGGAGVGAVYGLHSYNQRYKNRSRANYNTFLRNQLLKGNVRPGEVPASDYAAVRKMGLR